MGKSGYLTGVLLVHRSGALTCGKGNPNFLSRWGCGSFTHLDTVVTDANKKQLFKNQEPQEGFIPKTSDELRLVDLKEPMRAGIDSELQIWYPEDLEDKSEYDNAGVHCVDVYTKVVDHY